METLLLSAQRAYIYCHKFLKITPSIDDDDDDFMERMMMKLVNAGVTHHTVIGAARITEGKG